jgi:hypothetical protein
MAATKSVRKSTAHDAPKPQRPADSWRPWWAWALFAGIVLVGAGRIVSTYSQLSITFDEPIHFVCGLEYLSKHVYRYETQHPPLERAMGALIPYLKGARIVGEPDVMLEAKAQMPAGPRYDAMLAQARLGVLPFFAIACTVVFLWARRYFGAKTAVVATAIFTTIPPVLAHAGLATTDMALTACLGAAFYCLMRWAEAPGTGTALLLGTWTGLSVLSKFTTLLYFPATAALALLGWLLLRRPAMAELWELIKRRAASFALAAAAAAVVIWAGYFFSFGTVPAWNPESYGPVSAWKASLRVPAPELFDGIEEVLAHNRRGHTGYLLGERSSNGWWYFFPVLLGVKTPVTVLALFFAGLAACRFWREPRGWLLLAFTVGILGSAMPGNINIGVRHVLPLYIAVSILAGLAVVRLCEAASGRGAAALAAALVLCAAWPGIRQHPDYLSYMNTFAGEFPEEVAADSDFEWGQDFKLLGKRLRELGAREVTMYVLEFRLGFSDREWMQKEYGLPPIRDFNKVSANPGWTVISATKAGIVDGGWRRHGQEEEKLTGVLSGLNRPWYARMYPNERVGGLLLYYTPAVGGQGQ